MRAPAAALLVLLVRTCSAFQHAAFPAPTHRMNRAMHGRMASTAVADADLRNIAIIAHVDHGKTTLVDAMLKGAST